VPVVPLRAVLVLVAALVLPAVLVLLRRRRHRRREQRRRKDHPAHRAFSLDLSVWGWPETPGSRTS
jgi:UDP-N-acetylmuramyl pentapeptide phosphotransferase/UDP-N-acetylglucosamine-1-phosphate transferase